MRKVLGFLLLNCSLLTGAIAAPPFSGTIFLDPDIILPSDPTNFLKLEDAGRGDRLMFDRRINGWITLNAFLFTASYMSGPDIEIQVNPEFENQDDAPDWLTAQVADEEFITTYARDNAHREDIISCISRGAVETSLLPNKRIGIIFTWFSEPLRPC